MVSKRKILTGCCLSLFWLGTYFVLSPAAPLQESLSVEESNFEKFEASYPPSGGLPAVRESPRAANLTERSTCSFDREVISAGFQIENGDSVKQPDSSFQDWTSGRAKGLASPIADAVYTTPGVYQNAAAPLKHALREAISHQDQIILASLPPICRSELPGLDLAEQDEGLTLAMLEMANGEASEAPQQVIYETETTHSNPQVDIQLLDSLFEAVSSHGTISSARDRTSSPGSLSQDSAPVAMFNPHSTNSQTLRQRDPNSPDPHLHLYSRTAFPSAVECAQCHQQIYEEWASSSHAYASISPMFHAFEDTINRLSQGTIGYFCLRCHAPVATTMGLRRDQPIWDGPRVFREGVTCVVCHRVKSIYTKASGERRIEPGDIYDPVYGSGSGEGVEIANKYAQFFKFKTSPSDPSLGQPIHNRTIHYEELKESSFCMSCHHVQVKPGIKLEVVWDQYRASPAYRDGISCQDCHMGKVPGVAEGYSVGPAAVFEGKTVNPQRRHSNHVFYGPGYSIAHPGIFPDDPKADRWSVNHWLEFDWRAGWGTDAFEEQVAAGITHSYFPPIWQSADDRYDAREIVQRNLKKLGYKKDLRRQVLENGSKLDGPFFTQPPTANQKLNFYYCLTSLNSGHNMPSGSLGAQPQVWMNVVLIDPAGNRIWESGYLDSNGDLADRHSADVLARKIPYDEQLMNLQTRFLTTNVKGTDREMYIPINVDIDQLPFLRPAPQPVSVLNHPPLIRMEAHSLPPLGSRNVKYSIPAKLIGTPGSYRLSVRMRSRAEPIYFMKFCNATPEMIRSMNEGIVDFHIQSVVFEVH
jgi:hypothetical protein